ncbi:MAG TPA: AAA family ATPase [Streptosporangiaceae bacterium]|nr:AAA family ATPase [Streptosporangiaceae bacterium]
MGEESPRRTLAARLAARDRDLFAGRRAELAFLRRCLDNDPPASVVHITGPGGIGKSTLLREAARRAADQGREVVAVDGREFGPSSGALESVLRNAARHDDPLVLIDSYERMTALDGYLRRDLLPMLADRSLVIIAGRGAPDAGWFAGGWEALTARLDLGGMPAPDARLLLASRGVTDDRVPAIIDWAGGSPLALALAADVASSDTGWNVATDPRRPDILRSLIHRLTEAELRDVRLSALGTAAIARTTTPQLLRAVLPHDDDGDAAYQQLCELTITEPVGDGITLHDLVRKALQADLRLRNQELERDLRRRIIDYLYQTAADGRPLLIIDMAHLVENPLLRWGFGWDGDAGYRIDSVRGEDADQVEKQFRTGQNWQWWQLTRRFFVESSDRAAVARDVDDRICGYMACVSLASVPAFAATDPLIGPWLAHARSHAAHGESVLWHAAVDFTGQGKVQAMLGVAGVLRSGAANPRFAYLPIDPDYPGALAFAQALGAVHHTDLDARIGDQLVQCHRLDYGPGGLIASLRAQVYAELGLPAPALPEPVPAARTRPASMRPAATLRAPTPAPAQATAELEVVRDALRHFLVPRDLARSPLARGRTVAERAESVRQLIWSATRDAFGDSATEKLLRSVLVAGYLEPLRSHEEAAAKLCLSRAAYFRRLRTAIERLAEHVAERQSEHVAERQGGHPAERRSEHAAERRLEKVGHQAGGPSGRPRPAPRPDLDHST